MADKEEPQKVEDDMSIDELSAAIDAHMNSIQKKKKPTKKTVEEPEEEPEEEPVEEGEEDLKDESEPEDDGTKIEVKRSYVAKGDEVKDTSMPAEEKGSMAETAKVSLKPLSASKKDESEEESEEEVEEEPEEEAEEVPKTSMVDVTVKKVEPKPEEENTESKESEEESIKESEEEAEEAIEEPPEEIEKEEPEAKEEPPKEPDPPKVVEEKPAEEEKTTPQPKQANQMDELAAQMPNRQGPRPDDEPPTQTLKTFDTKQYHIPIKPSHHHKKGSSFLVFIAVFATLLALVYVLSELEIIDIAELISSY